MPDWPMLDAKIATAAYRLGFGTATSCLRFVHEALMRNDCASHWGAFVPIQGIISPLLVRIMFGLPHTKNKRIVDENSRARIQDG
jgi:hypothetical protein